MADQSGRRSEHPSQVTACRRCRKQKLRCSRETPSCRRCLDISAVCAYPPPPDRKLLAAQRAQNAKARALRETEDGAPENELKHFLDHSNEEARQYSDLGGVPLENMPIFNFSSTEYTGRSASTETAATPPAPPVLRQVPFPSKEIALLLIEIYFSRLYNASLLFHKQTLLSDLDSRSIPDFIFLSIFALASIFLQQPPISIQAKAADRGLTVSVSDCARLAIEWATAASQQVLMQADQPRHETIQACQNLGLYWFSVGHTDRTNIHAHIAYRTCRLLGYHVQPAPGTEIDFLYGEIKRRCYWACWITSCISQENASFKSENWREVIGLPLPADEVSFSIGNPVSKERFDEQGHLEMFTGEASDHIGPSIMGEMVKIYGMWWEIQRFAKKYVHLERFTDEASNSSTKRFSTLQELDHRLETIYENLHPEFQYSERTSFKSAKGDPYQLFSLHCIHHLCACALHSSIVPLFSSIAPDPQMPKKVTRMSAEEAVDHSMLLIDLAADFLTTSPDKSRLPSMIGYAMFVAATIQFKSLGAQGKLRDYSLARLYPAVSILDQLKEYWRPLRGLWSELGFLFRSVGADINNLSSADPNYIMQQGHTNIDQIIKHDVVPSPGGGDLYTYVPDQDTKPESSRRPLSTHSQGLKSSAPLSTKSKDRKGKKACPPSRALQNDPIKAHIPAEQTTQIYQDQHSTLQMLPDRTAEMSDNYGIISSISHGFMAIDNVVGTSNTNTIEYSSTMEGMASMVENTMVIGDDGMHIDGSILWWDRSFDGVPPDKYGSHLDQPDYRGYYGPSA